MTVALKPIARTNPVVRQWRTEYLLGFAQASRDLDARAGGHGANPAHMHGFAFNAYTMGYRAGVGAAVGN
jgi:hypothetical protein